MSQKKILHYHPDRKVIANKLLISDRFSYNGIPGFRLTWRRYIYRITFLRYIRQGLIKLEKNTVCPCGGVSFSIIAQKERFGLPFESLMCDDCGLLILNPRMSSESLPTYYRNIYHPLICSTAPGKILRQLVRENQGHSIYNFLKDYINKKELNLCEIGCAGGENLLEFADSAAKDGIKCRLYGCEHEEHYVDYAKKRGLEVVSGGTASLSQFEVKFDLIILSHVLEHFNDPKEELKIISDLLSPEGFLYVEVPGVTNLADYYDDFLAYLVHAHNYDFNLYSLKKMLSCSEFFLVKGNEKVQALFSKYHGPVQELQDNNNPGILTTFLKNNEKAFINKLGILKKIKRLIWMSFYRLEYLMFLKNYMKNIYSLTILGTNRDLKPKRK